MTNEEAIQKIDKASFTGSDGLDYVETLVALDVIKMVTTSCEDAISRQAVLDIIEDKIKYGLAQLDPDEIVAISQYYHMEVEKLPSVKPQEPKTRWIPVSERLPEEDERVLISVNGKRGKQVRSATYLGGNCKSFWSDTGEFWDLNKKKDEKNLIAWMPLPKPFEPQESEVQA